MHATKQKFRSRLTGSLSYVILFVCVVGTTMASFAVYKQTEFLLQERLQDRLKAIVATAVLQISPDDIKIVAQNDDYETQSYKRMVQRLVDLRNANENIRFAYILRPTDNANIFKFVADADSMDPNQQLDLNHDGIIDDADALAFPGDEYDASEAPVLVNEAIHYPTTDDQLIPDQWGLLLSAYAPIQEKGVTIAVLGIDVDVTDVLAKIRATALPFILLVTFLFLVLFALTFSLVRIWNSRVNLMRELDRQKDELLSIVSHQLATPISSMKWYLEMMLDGDVGKLTKEQTEYVESLQFSAASLSDLTSMILDVSRIQLGRMKVDRTDLDTAKFFTEVAKSIDAKAKEKGVKFEKKIEKGLPVAMLDMRLMRMTLENLLSNAIKYTPKNGTVALEVCKKGKNLIYEVRDSGCGIPKEDQGKIFGKLFRASNVGKVDGNGFGLYVAKGAVEAQEGNISFESTEGKGTIFKVKLPIILPNKKLAKK